MLLRNVCMFDLSFLEDKGKIFRKFSSIMLINNTIVGRWNTIVDPQRFARTDC